MRASGFFVVLSASLAFGGAAAQAMPAGPTAAAGVSTPITLVANGCGPGFYRGPMGRCRPGRHRRMYYGVGFGGPHRTTATGGNAGGYSDRN